MSATHVVSTTPETAQIDAATPSANSEAAADNPWLAFFEDMRNAPRDEQWAEFSRVMRERPLNRVPVDRNLFADEK